MKHRKIIYILGGMLLIFAIICTATLIGSEKKNKIGLHRKKIGVIYMTMNNPYFDVINKEIEAVIRENGDQIITRDAGLDNDMQIRQISSLIEEDVDIILLNAVDWKKIRPGLELAKEAKIPVIAVDADVYDEELVNGVITSDNYAAGETIARDLMKRKKSADVLLLIQSNNISAQDRVQGFLDVLDKNHWPYRVVDRLECYGQLEIAQPMVEKILNEGKNVDVVMALNDPSALGAMAALDAAKMLDRVLVYGIDGAPTAKNMIAEKLMTATVAQSPKETGKCAVRYAYEILNGKTIKKKTIIPITFITMENIEKFSLNDWL